MGSISKSTSPAPGPFPRCTWPASFYGLKVFRFFFLAVVLAHVANAQDLRDGPLYANPEVQACVCEGTFDENKDYFPNKVESNFASDWWSVTYHNSYKKLSIFGKDYYLYQCGTPAPQVGANDTLVEIPVQKAAIDATNVVHFFDTLNQRTSLSYFINPYVEEDLGFVAPCMQKRSADGKIQGLTNAQAENKTDLDVGVYFYTFEGFGYGPISNAPSVYVNYAAGGRSLLKTGEFVEMVSLFFNREQAASGITTNMEGRYECVKNTITTGGAAKKSVVYAHIDQYKCANASQFLDSKVSFSGCQESGLNGKHYICDVLSDAGGQVPAIPADTPGAFSAGNYFLSMRDFLQLDIDLWVYSNDFKAHNASCGAVLDQVFENLTAWKSNAVYDIHRTGREVQSSYGPYITTDWLESADAQPDQVLLDIGSILSENIVSNHTRRFLRIAKGPEEEALRTTSPAQCANEEEPLYVDWTDGPCDVSSGKDYVDGLAPVGTSDKCDDDGDGNLGDGDNAGATNGPGYVALCLFVASVLSSILA